VSAFGRSVAAHVRALQEGCASTQQWSADDAQWESDFEQQVLAERERRRRAKQEEKVPYCHILLYLLLYMSSSIV
jgi:hypothetical protein